MSIRNQTTHNQLLHLAISPAGDSLPAAGVASAHSETVANPNGSPSMCVKEQCAKNRWKMVKGQSLTKHHAKSGRNPHQSSKSGQMGREPFCKVPEPCDPFARLFFPIGLLSCLRATQLFVALAPCPQCLQSLVGLAAVRFCFDQIIRSSSDCHDLLHIITVSLCMAVIVVITVLSSWTLLHLQSFMNIVLYTQDYPARNEPFLSNSNQVFSSEERTSA